MKKGFILGFLCAALLFTAIGAGVYTLVPSTTKLVVDGAEVKDDKLPVLYMEPGYNYVPAAVFRAICDKIGVRFAYVEANNAIQIDTRVKETVVTNKLVKEGDNVSVPLNKYGLPDFSTYTGVKPVLYNESHNFFNWTDTSICNDGIYKFFEYGEVKYISLTDKLSFKKFLPSGFYFHCPFIDGKVSYVLQLAKRDFETDDQVILIDEIPYAIYGNNRDYYIPYDYYLDTIIPLTQEGAK